jgi:hypothetical protein
MAAVQGAGSIGGGDAGAPGGRDNDEDRQNEQNEAEQEGSSVSDGLQEDYPSGHGHPQEDRRCHQAPSRYWRLGHEEDPWLLPQF